MRKNILGLGLLLVLLLAFTSIAMASDINAQLEEDLHSHLSLETAQERRIWHWHSDEQWVAFWPGNVYTHVTLLGTQSEGFRFGQRFINARSAWSSAVVVNFGQGTTANAQVRAYAGHRSEIESYRGETGTTWTGLATYAPRSRVNTSAIPNGTITIPDGTQRRVYRFSGQARIFVVQRWTGSTWTSEQINRTQKTTTHELGHVLGFAGHSPDNLDVMWAYNTVHHTIRFNERLHLSQIYSVRMSN